MLIRARLPVRVRAVKEIRVQRIAARRFLAVARVDGEQLCRSFPGGFLSPRSPPGSWREHWVGRLGERSTGILPFLNDAIRIWYFI